MESNAPPRSSRQPLRAVAPLLTALACAAAWFSPAANAVLANGFPEKMAIYYGPPQQVNGSAGNTTSAAAVFDDYDLVVFAEGIEQVADPSHTPTQTIIGNIAATTRSYGYIDLCVQNPVSSLYRCRNWTLQQLKDRVDAWQAMGVAGIFLDQAGCDYVVSRQRQNDIVNYVHGKSLSAFINVWDQDHAFAPGSIPSPYPGYANCNPTNLPPALNSNDYSLLESWAVLLSDWTENYDPNMVIPRANKALAYKATYGTKIATVNTIATGNPSFNQNQLNYVWWSTLLYGFDAMAWGETWVYSSDTNSLPFRTRPNPNSGSIGTAIMPITVAHNGDLHTRATSSNTIHLDTAGHSGAFGSKNIALQPSMKPTTLMAGDATFTPSNATFTINSNTAPITNFRLFIDSDNNSATGYRHSAVGITNNGADYMLDSGNLYSFTGGTQTTWSWSSLAAVSPTGIGTTRISVTVARSLIGHTSATTIGLLGANLSTGGVELDLLPRAPAAKWDAKPAYLTQSGTNATDLIAADAVFSESDTGDRLTFKLTSNGAPINQYRVWVDSDNNPATGYAYWGLGADYFLENGYFHRFTGPNQSTWSWTLVGSVLEGVSNPAHGVGTTQITATINPDQFNYVQGALVGFLMQHYQATAPFDLDLLPRSGVPKMMVDNTETQVGVGTNLISSDATFAATTVAFTIRSNGTNISSYRIFIDRDNNSATGYRHTAQGITATGANYMVENGNLYSFSGATQTTWGWTLIGAVTQSGVNTTAVTVTVPKTQISYVANSTMATVAENLSGSTSLDLFIRAANTTWRVKP
jgi:hypothetical protein